ncbi:hypothetical protein [Calothrix sp. PCC 7507]|uniref:hypothetical protein n=1 Tax=Calothrix sp. PCC 7507 TaxID=99598 RepID=UPI000308C4D8|nr:hypothetical protein [Calothrix sp. PCC 7507]
MRNTTQVTPLLNLGFNPRLACFGKICDSDGHLVRSRCKFWSEHEGLVGHQSTNLSLLLKSNLSKLA